MSISYADNSLLKTWGCSDVYSSPFYHHLRLMRNAALTQHGRTLQEVTKSYKQQAATTGQYKLAQFRLFKMYKTLRFTTNTCIH